MTRGRAYEALLVDLIRAIEDAPAISDAYQRVCDALYTQLETYSWVGIYVVESTDLVLAAWSGPEETEHARIAIGEGICGLAAATGETEIVADVSERPEFIACFPSTRSEIVVPIHGPDGVIGEIDVDSDGLDAFDDDDRAFLETVAGHLAERASESG